jgi:hypothetical protein
LAQVEVAAQPDTGLTRVPRGAFPGGGGPPGGKRRVKGECGLVVRSSDIDHNQAGSDTCTSLNPSR